MVILVCGLPGSGKSYFAEKLAQKIGAEYFNSDQMRKEMFPERTYSEAEKSKVYEALLKKMQQAIEEDKDVVLDATFYKKQTREPFITHSRERIVFIEVWADEKIILERLKKIRPYSEADFKIYKLIKQQWQSLEQAHLKLQSTNDNIDDMLHEALNYLKHEKGTS